jgi:hypothetical protein
VSLRQSIVTLYTLFAFLSRGISQDSIPPIGQWRDHLPYHSAIDVQAGNNKIFCATPIVFLVLICLKILLQE